MHDGKRAQSAAFYSVAEHAFRNDHNLADYIFAQSVGTDAEVDGSLLITINTHYERAEYFLQSIASPAYLELVRAWIAGTGAWAAVRREMIDHMVHHTRSKLESLAEDWQAAIGNAAQERTPRSAPFGLVPSEFWIAVPADTQIATVLYKAPRALPAGWYKCVANENMISEEFHAHCETHVRLVGGAPGLPTHVVRHDAVSELCSQGHALVAFVFNCGLPTHFCGPAIPHELCDLPQIFEVQPIEPSFLAKSALDQIDLRFLSKLGGRSYWHYIWLSWFYHPTFGLVRDGTRYSLARNVASIAHT